MNSIVWLRFLEKLMLIPLAGILCSCSVLAPTDLRFESLSVVTLKQEPQLLNWKLENTQSDLEKIHLLKIAFSSETDIVQFAKKNGFNVGYEAYLCDKNSKIESQIYSLGYLRAGEQSLGGAAYFERPNLENLRHTDGRITYYAVLPVESKELHFSLTKQQSKFDKMEHEFYDFQRHTSNVCLQLRGGAMSGGSFSSNLLMVPREEILKALR